MFQKSTILRLVVVLWLLASLYLITWGMSFASLAQDFFGFFDQISSSLSALGSDFAWPSFMTWDNAWLISLGLAVLPATLGILLDFRGQAASGWILIFGLGASAALLVGVTLSYIGWTVFSLMFIR